MMKIAAVVGAGPGLGGSVAVRFAKAGYAVALMSRTEDSVRNTAEKIAALGGKSLMVSTDVNNQQSVSEAFARVKQELGSVNVLVYNTPTAFKPQPILQCKEEDFVANFKIATIGLLLSAQQVLPDMITRKEGVILVSSATAAYRGGANFGVFATSKHAAHGLTQSIAREHGKNGVHVAHIRVDCGIDGPAAKAYMGEKYDSDLFGNPDQIAETYLWLAQQPKHAWTNEIDLRPYRENWTC